MQEKYPDDSRNCFTERGAPTFVPCGGPVRTNSLNTRKSDLLNATECNARYTQWHSERPQRIILILTVILTAHYHIGHSVLRRDG